jgi:hypothetical protein
MSIVNPASGEQRYETSAATSSERPNLMLGPSSAEAIAVARPVPEVPPVTRATFPANKFIIASQYWYRVGS